MHAPARPRLLLLALSAALPACGEDPKPTGPDNLEPTVQITNPVSGDVLLAEIPNLLQGSVSDDKTPNDQLEVTWFAGAEEICPATLANADGTTTCTAELSPLQYDITLMVRDAEGLAASTQTRVAINPLNAPTARIISATTTLDAGGTSPAYYADLPIEVVGYAVDEEGEDPPDELRVSWEYALAEDGEAVALSELNGSPDPDGNVVVDVLLPADDPTVPTEVTVRMKVLDSTGKETVDEEVLEVYSTNTPPEIEIIRPNPASPSTPPDISVQLSGTVTDINVPSRILTYRWVSDIDGVLTDTSVDPEGWVSVSDSGVANCTTGGLTLGKHNFTLEGRDELGAITALTEQHTIGSPPAIVITSPADNETFNEGTVVTLRGTVADPDIAEEVVTVRWLSDLDGELFEGRAVPADVADTSVNIATPVATSDVGTGPFLRPGTHVITFEAEDESGIEPAQRSRSININQVPTTPVISLTPGTPTTDADLILTHDLSTDPDAAEAWNARDSSGIPTITYFYQWTRNGVTYGDRTTTRVPARDTTRGQVWSVSVIATDGVGPSAAATSSVTIQNSLPTLTAATITPTTPFESSSQLTCVPGTTADIDGDTVTLRYSWLVNGVSPSITTSTLSNTHWSSGDVVTCTVTPFDGTDLGVPLVSSPVTIQNSVPSVSGVSLTPSSTTTPKAGSTVTCNFTFSDDDPADTDQSIVEWYVGTTRIGTGVGRGATINSGFYFPDTLTCQVTPFDGTSRGAVRQSSVTIKNTAPVLSAVTVSPSPAVEGDTLTCTPGTVNDNDDPTRVAPYSFTYAWTVNGITLATQTTSTLSSAYFNRDNTVICTVTPNDGTDNGAAVSSTPLVITNSTPTIATVTVTPNPAFEGDGTLTCAASGVADTDGDTVNLAYQWVVNSAVISSATTGTLSAANWRRDDVVVCTVTPSDSGTTGAAVSSIPLTISNTTPIVSNVAISPDPARFGDTLICDWDYVDDDVDADVSVVTWTINGATLTGASSVRTTTHSGDTVVGGFDYNDVVQCAVSARDGTAIGTTVQDALTVSNTPPVLASVSLAPTTAYTNTDVTCSHPAATDVDAVSTLSYTYRWLLNGSTISGQTGTTLSSSFFNKGQSVNCAVTPNDGAGAGTEVLSNTVGILNSAPVVTAAAISPNPAVEGDTLSCDDTGKSDADGDTVTLAYTWSVGGTTLSGQTARTLAPAFFSRDQAVVCTITPNDGTVSGTTVASSGLSVANTPPSVSAVTVTGVGTSGPTVARFGDTVLCDWTFTDTDGDADSSTVVWTINGAALTGASTQSTTAHPGDTLRGGFDYDDVVACAVTPYDGTDVGTVASGSLTITNTAPVLASAALTPTTAFRTNVLTCTPGTTTDVDAIRTLTTTYRWLRNGTAISGQTNSTLPANIASKGQTIQCEATPNDGVENGAAVLSNSVVIQNSLPVLGTVSITPSSAFETSTLTCAAATVTDADSDTVSQAYAWSVNGTTIGATTSTLTGSSFQKGDSVICTITPNDGTASGTAVASSARSITNSTPTVSSVTISPTTPLSTDTLSCSYTFADGDPTDTDQSTIEWRRSSTVIGTGATISSTLGVPFTTADVVTCRVTPYDGETAGTVATASKTITNTVPVLSAVTLTSSATPAVETSTLTCTPGTTTDVDGTTSFTYTYAWTRDGTTIAGATGTTLTGTYFNRGQVVACVVTPNDGTGAGSAVTSNTISVQNSLPTLSSVAISPASPASSNNLTCNVSGVADADSDAVTTTYAWTKNGSVLSGQTASTLNKNQHANGDAIFCTVTLSDSTGSATPVSSTTVTIGNSVPTATAAVSPSSPLSSDTLTCTTTTDDEDGDAVTLTYAWLVNGSVVSGATSSTLSSTLGVPFAGGNTVACRVTPADAFGTGTAVTSTAVTVANGAPTIGTVTLTSSSTPVVESSTLTCTPSGTTDPDGTTSFTYTYTWLQGTSTISGATGSTLTGTNFSKNQLIRCSVVASDGAASSAAVTSNTLTITNSAPTVSLSKSPATATETSTLNPTPTGADIDSDTVTFTYAWTVDGSAIAPTTSTLTGTHFNKGQTVAVVVTPNDGTVSGTTATTNWVIQNTAPVTSAVSVTPASPTAGTTLTCTPTASDVDGDSLTYSYQWSVNGVNVGAPQTTGLSTAAGVTYSGGQVVTCTVTATDGTASATAVSGSVTAANSAPDVTGVTLTSSATPARETSTLTCAGTATDPDGTTPTITYTWESNGAVISGATTSTLTGTNFNKGQLITCIATASDGSLTDSLESTGITISNSAPTLATPTITASPSPAREPSTLTCAAVGTDADGDSLTITYAWQDAGVAIGGATTSTLTGTNFSRGSSITCSASASDGTDSSAVGTSAATTIQNSTPTATLATSTADPVTKTSTLTATFTTSDADPGDTVSLTYAWTRNSTTVGGQTTATYSGTQNKGDIIVLSATPSDGTATGTAATKSWTIANTAPTNPVAVLESNATLSDEPDTASVLTCAVDTASTDADGDTITYTATWERNGVAYTTPGISTVADTPAVTNNTLGAAATTDGDEWTCILTASDGTASSPVPGEDSLFIHYLIGSLAATGGSEELDADQVIFLPITTSSLAADLVDVNVAFATGTTTGSFNVAVYAADGTAGAPGTRVGTAVSGTAAVGTVTVDMTGAGVTLTASTNYWLAVRSVGNDLLLRHNTGGANIAAHRASSATSLPTDASTLTLAAATPKAGAYSFWVY
ncbi:MAG: hypothetical protein JNM72_25650 [Deltaproteobacteria bacterium]|nr:hypothetical protein [Deltaproteobacteria bacterium]